MDSRALPSDASEFPDPAILAPQEHAKLKLRSLSVCRGTMTGWRLRPRKRAKGEDQNAMELLQSPFSPPLRPRERGAGLMLAYGEFRNA